MPPPKAVRSEKCLQKTTLYCSPKETRGFGENQVAHFHIIGLAAGVKIAAERHIAYVRRRCRFRQRATEPAGAIEGDHGRGRACHGTIEMPAEWISWGPCGGSAISRTG